jgi:hypothetical protein
MEKGFSQLVIELLIFWATLILRLRGKWLSERLQASLVPQRAEKRTSRKPWNMTENIELAIEHT